MLRTLTIRDFILVNRVELEFQPGFSVLTGETGAGKSILLDALTLVLGGRAEAGIVRHGSEKAEIAACFDVAKLPALQAMLREQDLCDADDSECLLRRVLDAQGKSRGYVNGRPATATQLREIGEALLDLHGQHSHQSLLRADAQRQLVDDFGGHSSLVRQVADAWKEWRAILVRQQGAAQASARLNDEREHLEQRMADLDALKLAENEWDALGVEQSRLAHAAGLIEGTTTAIHLLAEDETSCESQLRRAQARLFLLQQYDRALAEPLAMLESSQIQLTEAVHALSRYQQTVELDPAELRKVEARLSAIHDTARKYRTRPQELTQLAASTRARLSELATTLDSEALAREEAAARSRYESLASALREGRQRSAGELSTKVTEIMQALALSGGAFSIALNPLDPPASYGTEQVEFLVSAHPDLPARPLARVASGGELSRISLAIQVVTSEVAQVPTLIFDEVDVGVGGGVAEIVGRLLRRLGNRRQVLCVTHLPQVAACAHEHYVVSKEDGNGSGMRTEVQVLAKGERIEEIARMLGGVTITDKTRAHAKEMLAGLTS
jgi:DNA repair protein RecN (Recombination protein N)